MCIYGLPAFRLHLHSYSIQCLSPALLLQLPLYQRRLEAMDRVLAASWELAQAGPIEPTAYSLMIYTETWGSDDEQKTQDQQPCQPSLRFELAQCHSQSTSMGFT